MILFTEYNYSIIIDLCGVRTVVIIVQGKHFSCYTGINGSRQHFLFADDNAFFLCFVLLLCVCVFSPGYHTIKQLITLSNCLFSIYIYIHYCGFFYYLTGVILVLHPFS